MLCLLSQISSVSVYLMGQAALMAKNHLFFTPGSTMAGADAGEACYQRNIAEQCASAGAPQILV